MSFLSLVIHNVGAHKVRSALTALAVAVGVMTVVTLGLVNHSMRSSAFALMQTGRADFTVAQKGVSDILNSSIDAYDLTQIQQRAGVADAVGVLISTTRLNPSNPLFLQIGVPRSDLANFGVTVVEGRAYGGGAPGEMLLGWRAARNLGKHVGDTLAVGGRSERIVGLFRTDQALADTGAMFPLSVLQNWKRQAGEVTLVFIQLKPGVNVQQFRQRLETDEPQLTTVMTMSDFGRADRSMQLINAADQGSRLLAVLVGALIVMSMMTMAFIERIREFGVLSAVGWPPRRVMGLVLAEAGALGVLGAAAGVGLSVAAAQAVPHLASVSGILQIQFTTDAVWRALYTAAGMTLLGAAYPAARAALLSPLEALRHE